MGATIESRWNEAEVAGASEERLLLYRSNLEGSDLRITNYGGGNTSAKVRMVDPLTGEPVDVLWVKGSGGDLGSAKLDSFATLYMERLLALEAIHEKNGGRAAEDAMPALYPHCTFGLNPRAASIDTPLHAFVPFRHADHLHPDSVIAIATARDGERITKELWGERIGWMPWQRPGFDLGLRIRDAIRARPKLQGLVLAGHGLINWADTSRGCYELSLALINDAIGFLARRTSVAFGGEAVRPRGEPERRAFAAALAPALRGKLSREQRKVGHFDDSSDLLEFASGRDAARLCSIGTSCPDHFLRTKIRPLFVECDAATTAPQVIERLDPLLAEYVAGYRAYHERCRETESPPLRDPFPVLIVLPGIGLFSFSKDKAMARQAAEFWVNAIHVMHGAERLGGYVAIPEKEAFGIEYWQLEEAKLKRLPPEKELSRRVALITGGAGAIGKACARRLLADGACVVLCDVDAAALAAAEAELSRESGRDVVRAVVADATREPDVVAALDRCAVEYGGVDLLVLSAGLASAAPFDETTLELWQRNLDVLATGCFLFAREGFKSMKRQGLGGSIVFIASKNALAASPQAAAYCSAKAAELHLARCLALEGAPFGIRVNSVNPDAVLKDSRLWQGGWRSERAAAYGIAEKDLDEHYKKRSLLGRSVFAEDVAEAVLFFASERSSKSTGNVLNVDAGNKEAFPR